MKTPLEKHNQRYRKKLASIREHLNALVNLAGVSSVPPSVIEHLSVAYRDLQTSLNNLNDAHRTVRSLLSSSPSDFQASQGQQNNQESNSPSPSSPTSESQTQTSPLPPQSLESLNRKLKNLEYRQISLVRKYRKCFAYLGFRQSFVDSLEGVASVYEEDFDPPINPRKGLLDASTE